MRRTVTLLGVYLCIAIFALNGYAQPRTLGARGLILDDGANRRIQITDLNRAIGIGTSNPDPSSILHLDGLGSFGIFPPYGTGANAADGVGPRGVLLPRMTTAQRNDIDNPANGLLIYNTDAGQFQYYNGGTFSWTPMATSGWSVLGNTIPAAGTGPGGNFIGTLNAQDFVIATNVGVAGSGAGERIRVTSAGAVNILTANAGTTAIGMTGANSSSTVINVGNTGNLLLNNIGPVGAPFEFLTKHTGSNEVKVLGGGGSIAEQGVTFNNEAGNFRFRLGGLANTDNPLFVDRFVNLANNSLFFTNATTANMVEFDGTTGNVGISSPSVTPTSRLHVVETGITQDAIFASQTAATGTNSAIEAEINSTAANAAAIIGRVNPVSPGGFSSAVRGINNGTGGLGIGVYGSQNGSGWGVYGTTPSGIGVHGVSNTGFGLFGISTSGTAVFGQSSTGSAGVFTNTAGAAHAVIINDASTGHALQVNSNATGTGVEINGGGVSLDADGSSLLGDGAGNDQLIVATGSGATTINTLLNDVTINTDLAAGSGNDLIFTGIDVTNTNYDLLLINIGTDEVRRRATADLAEQGLIWQTEADGDSKVRLGVRNGDALGQNALEEDRNIYLGGFSLNFSDNSGTDLLVLNNTTNTVSINPNINGALTNIGNNNAGDVTINTDILTNSNDLVFNGLDVPQNDFDLLVINNQLPDQNSVTRAAGPAVTEQGITFNNEGGETRIRHGSLTAGNTPAHAPFEANRFENLNGFTYNITNTGVAPITFASFNGATNAINFNTNQQGLVTIGNNGANRHLNIQGNSNDVSVGGTLGGNPALWDVVNFGDYYTNGIINLDDNIWIDGDNLANLRVQADGIFRIGTTNASDVLLGVQNLDVIEIDGASQNVGIQLPASPISPLQVSGGPNFMVNTPGADGIHMGQDPAGQHGIELVDNGGLTYIDWTNDLVNDWDGRIIYDGGVAQPTFNFITSGTNDMRWLTNSVTQRMELDGLTGNLGIGTAANTLTERVTIYNPTGAAPSMIAGTSILSMGTVTGGTTFRSGQVDGNRFWLQSYVPMTINELGQNVTIGTLAGGMGPSVNSLLGNDNIITSNNDITMTVGTDPGDELTLINIDAPSENIDVLVIHDQAAPNPNWVRRAEENTSQLTEQGITFNNEGGQNRIRLGSLTNGVDANTDAPFEADRFVNLVENELLFTGGAASTFNVLQLEGSSGVVNVMELSSQNAGNTVVKINGPALNGIDIDPVTNGILIDATLLGIDVGTGANKPDLGINIQPELTGINIDGQASTTMGINIDMSAPLLAGSGTAFNATISGSGPIGVTNVNGAVINASTPDDIATGASITTSTAIGGTSRGLSITSTTGGTGFVEAASLSATNSGTTGARGLTVNTTAAATTAAGVEGAVINTLNTGTDMTRGLILSTTRTGAGGTDVRGIELFATSAGAGPVFGITGAVSSSGTGGVHGINLGVNSNTPTINRGARVDVVNGGAGDVTGVLGIATKLAAGGTAIGGEFSANGSGLGDNSFGLVVTSQGSVVTNTGALIGVSGANSVGVIVNHPAALGVQINGGGTSITNDGANYFGNGAGIDQMITNAGLGSIELYSNNVATGIVLQTSAVGGNGIDINATGNGENVEIQAETDFNANAGDDFAITAGITGSVIATQTLDLQSLANDVIITVPGAASGDDLILNGIDNTPTSPFDILVIEDAGNEVRRANSDGSNELTEQGITFNTEGGETRIRLGDDGSGITVDNAPLEVDRFVNLVQNELTFTGGAASTSPVLQVEGSAGVVNQMELNSLNAGNTIFKLNGPAAVGIDIDPVVTGMMIDATSLGIHVGTGGVKPTMGILVEPNTTGIRVDGLAATSTGVVVDMTAPVVTTAGSNAYLGLISGAAGINIQGATLTANASAAQSLGLVLNSTNTGGVGFARGGDVNVTNTGSGSVRGFDVAAVGNAGGGSGVDAYFATSTNTGAGLSRGLMATVSGSTTDNTGARTAVTAAGGASATGFWTVTQNTSGAGLALGANLDVQALAAGGNSRGLQITSNGNPAAATVQGLTATATNGVNALGGRFTVNGGSASNIGVEVNLGPAGAGNVGVDVSNGGGIGLRIDDGGQSILTDGANTLGDNVGADGFIAQTGTASATITTTNPAADVTINTSPAVDGNDLVLNGINTRDDDTYEVMLIEDGADANPNAVRREVTGNLAEQGITWKSEGGENKIRLGALTGVDPIGTNALEAGRSVYLAENALRIADNNANPASTVMTIDGAGGVASEGTVTVGWGNVSGTAQQRMIVNGFVNGAIGNTLALDPNVWDLVVRGDQVTTGIAKFGGSLWVDGISATHQITSLASNLDIYTTTGGDLSLYTGGAVAPLNIRTAGANSPIDVSTGVNASSSISVSTGGASSPIALSTAGQDGVISLTTAGQDAHVRLQANHASTDIYLTALETRIGPLPEVAPTSTLQVGGSLAAATASGGTIGLNATNFFYLVNAANQTITLPNAATCNGRIYVIKNNGAATNTTVNSAGGQIDGGAAFVQVAANAAVQYISDGANWWIISTN